MKKVWYVLFLTAMVAMLLLLSGCSTPPPPPVSEFQGYWVAQGFTFNPPVPVDGRQMVEGDIQLDIEADNSFGSYAGLDLYSSTGGVYVGILKGSGIDNNGASKSDVYVLFEGPLSVEALWDSMTRISPTTATVNNLKLRQKGTTIWYYTSSAVEVTLQ